MFMRNPDAFLPVSSFEPCEILFHKLFINEFVEALLWHYSEARRYLKGKSFCCWIQKFEKVNFEDFRMVRKNAWQLFLGNVLALKKKKLKVGGGGGNYNVIVWTVIKKTGEMVPNEWEVLGGRRS